MRRVAPHRDGRYRYHVRINSWHDWGVHKNPHVLLFLVERLEGSRIERSGPNGMFVLVGRLSVRHERHSRQGFPTRQRRPRHAHWIICAAFGASRRPIHLVVIIVRRGSLQVDRKCRRHLLPTGTMRWHVVRRHVLLHPGALSHAGDVVRFVLRCEVHQCWPVRSGPHGVMMWTGWRRYRPVGQLTVFVATLSTATTATTGTTTATAAGGTRVDALHLTCRIQYQLYPVRALIVDAPAAHGFGKIMDHCPRHARQVAQVAVLPFRLYRHFDCVFNQPLH